MTKRIYPGNFVNRLSAWQGQAAVCEPGRAYFSALGYALITSQAASSWDIVIPSPDLRPDDKPRRDISPLVIPAGARVYFAGIRIPDMRKERSAGTAFSGLVGTNGERLKLADALANDNNITTAIIATNSADCAFANGTITPRQARVSVTPSATLAAAETLKIYATQNDGTTASAGGVTSSVAGGTPIIVEVNYWLPDDVADLEDIKLPFRVEN